MSEEAIAPVEGEVAPVEGIIEEAPARPDWHLEKYKTVDDQAKAYVDLQKKFGGLTGAPEAYELSIPDEFKEAGFDLDAKDPLIGELNEFARANNVSQEMYNGMVELYGKVNLAQAEWANEYKAGEMKALGDNAAARIDSISKWGRANLDAELFNGLEDAAVSAGAIRAIEALIGKTRNAPQVGKDAPAAPAVSKADWNEKRFGSGKDRYMKDKDYRREVDAMRDAVFGTEEHRQIIG
jgi:hypothetical protein